MSSWTTATYYINCKINLKAHCLVELKYASFHSFGNSGWMGSVVSGDASLYFFTHNEEKLVLAFNETVCNLA